MTFRFAGGLRRRTARLASALLVALALTGCLTVGPALAPTAGRDQMMSMMVSPHLTETSFVAADGRELPLYRWEPANWGWTGAPRAVIVAFHGFNDYANAFSVPAPDWARQGIATYAIDQRGFGRNPDRGEWAGSRAMLSDARALVTVIKRENPGVPVYVLGESMGGAVALAALSGGRPQVDGVVLVAPALWGEQVMNPMYRAALWFARTVMPEVKFTGKGLERRPSDNIEMLRAFGRDPLVIKGARSEAVAGLVDLMGLGLEAARNHRVPTLVLYGANEQIVDGRAVQEGIRRLRRDSNTVAVYPNGWHMLMRDLDGRVVIEDITAWILNREAPLPSGHAIYPSMETAARARPVVAAAGAVPATP